MARGQYWKDSFRSSDFNGGDRSARPKQGRHRGVPDLAPPPSGEGQHECPRGAFCASSTRDDDGAWHPLLINSVFCVADESAIVNAIPGLAESWERLAGQAADPLRSRGTGPGGRRPPGSRVLVDAGADALLREAAMTLNGWAARVRGVPGISLSPRRHLPDTLAGVTENCDVLAKWTTQLLALPPGPTLRTWEYAPGRPEPRPAAPSLAAMGAARSESLGLGGPRPPRPGPAVPAVPCRRCGLFVVPSPSGKHWWPAVCTHAAVLESAWAEDRDGNRYPVAWACAECSTPFRGSLPRPRPACDHRPAGAPPARSGGIPADTEAEIEGLEVVRAGDGWVTCFTSLAGADAGLDVLELTARFRRLLGESPARPEALDGVPCRNCEAMASLVRADPPSDPKAEAMHSRCETCGDVMGPGEFREWVRQWDAYVKHGEPVACRRCQLERHAECFGVSCGCAAAGHAA